MAEYRWMMMMSVGVCLSGSGSGCGLVIGLEDTRERSDAVRDGGVEPAGLRHVHLVAAGIIEPVSVRLQAAGKEEQLGVTRDGRLTFETELADGDSYAASLVSAPPECELAHATGVVHAGDVEIVLVCRLLDDLTLVGERMPPLGFSTAQLGYRVEVSLLLDSVSVTATASRPDIEVDVAGQGVASGVPSEPLALGLGETVIPVVARHVASGAQVGYEITVVRAGHVLQAAYAKASNTGVDDHFGISVALNASGDTLAVGAHWEASEDTGVDGDEADDSAPYSGAVYVFRHDGTGWTQQAYLKASNTDSRDHFGISVALNASGDILAVGAHWEDSAATGVDGNEANERASDSGAVYVFEREDGSWEQQAYLKASNTDRSDLFGHSVALSASGDTLAVGAYMEDSKATGVNGDEADDDAYNSGAVYVFEHDGRRWRQQAYLKASNTGAGDLFGYSVALSESGDTLAAGAPGEAGGATGVGGDEGSNQAPWSGAVYVFERSGTTWTQQAYVKASNTGADDHFGNSVASSASGDMLAVGAPGEAGGAVGMDGDQADDSRPESGAAYLFQRDGTSWAQRAYIKASNTDSRDHFGNRVALSASGDTLAVGAPGEGSGATGMDGDQADESRSQSGAVYLFRCDDTTVAQKAYLKASNTGAGDRFGISMTLSDSGNTLAVGAPGEASGAVGVDGNQSDDSSSASGAAYLFR